MGAVETKNGIFISRIVVDSTYLKTFGQVGSPYSFVQTIRVLPITVRLFLQSGVTIEIASGSRG